jgi:hypothetical protein
MRGLYPTPLEFPKNLNPFAADIWYATCLELPKLNLPQKEAWVWTIERFVNQCQAKGLDPFFKGDANTAISQYLFKSRSQFILFLNRTKLLQGLKPIRFPVREARITEYGFEISISAQYRISDPTWLNQIFSFPIPYRFSRLRKHDKSFYSVGWYPGLEVFVSNEQINSPSQWHVGYTIRCPISPDTKGENPKDFILNRLWKPLTASRRPVKIPISRNF